MGNTFWILVILMYNEKRQGYSIKKFLEKQLTK